MNKFKGFLKRKDVVFNLQRYGIDALGAMAQGLFCTLLVGTILNTIGQQFHIGFLNDIVVTISQDQRHAGLLSCREIRGHILGIRPRTGGEHGYLYHKQ